MVNRKSKSNVPLWGENADSLGVKEEPYWDFVEVDNYIYHGTMFFILYYIMVIKFSKNFQLMKIRLATHY